MFPGPNTRFIHACDRGHKNNNYAPCKKCCLDCYSKCICEKKPVKELIEKKVKESEEKFTKLKEQIVKVEEEITKLQQARAQGLEEVARLQGEYRGYKSIIDELTKSNGGSKEEVGRVLDTTSRFSTKDG